MDCGKTKNVRVISRKKLKEAAATHAEATANLDAWYRDRQKIRLEESGGYKVHLVQWLTSMGNVQSSNIKREKIQADRVDHYQRKKVLSAQSSPMRNTRKEVGKNGLLWRT